MTCKHCLRGKAQNVDITHKVINRTLQHVTNINRLSFTGGEPLLNIPAIKYTFNQLHKKDINFFSFWLATNGSIYNQNFVNRLIEEYAYCIDYSGDDEFYGGIAVSLGDGYHTQVDKKNIIRYKALKFYDSSKDGKNNYLINEGRAKFNGIGINETFKKHVLSLDILNDEIRVESDIYINCLGDVLMDCDYSYSTQKRKKIGNVLETPLRTILLNNYKEAA
jgi:organic radical activating enzyme